jgi:hypothetical protein
MNAPSHTKLALRPLICFGSVVLAGLAGSVFTKGGFSFLGFLLVYLPAALIVSVMGMIFAIRANATLPRRHWGRTALTALLVLVGLVLAYGCFLLCQFAFYPVG